MVMKMKLFMIVLTALFPFLHEKSYKAEMVSCQKDQIIVKSEGSELNLSLFNTKITDDKGWDMTCSLLEEANTVTFEIDPSSKITKDLPVYLFADEMLLQEELLKKGYAYPIIKNPQYTYEKEWKRRIMRQMLSQRIQRKNPILLLFKAPYILELLFFYGEVSYLDISIKKRKQKKGI